MKWHKLLRLISMPAYDCKTYEIKLLLIAEFVFGAHEW
jgi:hypothetical protein